MGAEASTGSTIATTRGDAGADMRLTVVGTATGDEAVAKVQAGLIAETILSACAAASKFTAPANVWLGIARTEMERVG